MRGKFVFALLDGGKHRTEYLSKARNLAGRLMFATTGNPGDPWAALLKINNAQSDAANVTRLVKDGYIITSNVDGPGSSDADNQKKLDDSLASGMHYGSSDFPALVAGRAYWFNLPGGAPVEPNPEHHAPPLRVVEINARPSGHFDLCQRGAAAVPNGDERGDRLLKPPRHIRG